MSSVPSASPRSWRTLLSRVAAHIGSRSARQTQEETAQLRQVAQQHDGQITHLYHALERCESNLERFVQDQRKENELQREQSIARVTDSTGAIRRELGELAFDLNEFRASYSMGMASVMPKVAALEFYLTQRTRVSPGASPPDNRGTIEEYSPEKASSFSRMDAFYAALTSAFRGPEALVRARARNYLADIEPLRDLGPVLDVGSGNGEFLEVLRDGKFEAYGIDTNAICVDACRHRGLKAEQASAQEHLASVPQASLAVITAIHLVEHMILEDVLDFTDLALAALKPGGLLIIETLNPENVLVTSDYFYLDPSRQQLLPSALLRFILASRGLVDMELRRLPRDETAVPAAAEGEPWFGDVKALVNAFNDRFACPTDYAIIARRP